MPEQTRNRVIFHMPFFSGLHLRDLPVAVAQEVMNTAPELLNRDSCRDWVKPVPLRYDLDITAPEGEIHLQSYAQQVAQGVEAPMPQCAVERRGPRVLARREVKPSNPPEAREWPIPDASGTRWELGELSARIYDSGVGLLSVTYRVIPRSGMTWEEYRNATWRVSGEVKSTFRGYTEETIACLNEAAERHDWPIHSVSILTGLQPSADVLWSTLLHAIETPIACGREERKALGRVLVPDPAATDLEQSVDIKGTVLLLGPDACAVHDPTQLQEVAALARLIGVNHVCWATAVDYDMVLLRENTRLINTADTFSLKDADNAALDVLRLYGRVRSFRSAMTGIAVHLELVDSAIWRELLGKWGLGAQLENLDNKLVDLQQIYDRLTTTVTTLRARRLDNLVLAFTFASLITLGLTLIDFSQRPVGKPRTLALAIIGLLLVVAASAWISASRLIARRVGTEPRTESPRRKPHSRVSRRR
jgi:hypothetical protein